MVPAQKQSSFIGVNGAAFCTITTLGVAAIGCIAGAATTASTVAMVAYATFATLAIALGGAAISAYVKNFPKEDCTVSDYFNDMRTHAMVALPALIQYVAVTLGRAALEACAQLIGRKIRGADHTYQRIN
jgi:hypothetical protein